MDTLLQLVTEGGASAWLAAATFVLPGLALVLLEATRGHALRLERHLWAAILLPAAVALAGGFWKRALAPDPAAVEALAHRTLLFGLALSALLLALGLPAMARARARRLPAHLPPVRS